MLWMSWLQDTALINTGMTNLPLLMTLSRSAPQTRTICHQLYPRRCLLPGSTAMREGLTVEEEEQYNGYLARQLRPPVIFSPTLHKPCVNWMRLNTNMHRNLPVPQKHPKHGCSVDPTFYSTTRYRCLTNITVTTLLFETGYPFSDEWGFVTDMGVVPLPTIPIHGFMFCPERGAWVIASGNSIKS